MSNEILEVFLTTVAVVSGVIFPLLVWLALVNSHELLEGMREMYKHKREQRHIEKVINGNWHFVSSHQCPNGSMRVLTVINIDTRDTIDIGFDKDLLKKESNNHN